MLVGVALGWALGDGVGSASAGPTGQNRMNNTTANHPVTHLRLVMDLTISEPREQIAGGRSSTAALQTCRGKRTPPSSCVGRAIGPGSNQDFRPYCPGPRWVLQDVSPSRPVGQIEHGMRAARIRMGVGRSITDTTRRVSTTDLTAAGAAQTARWPRRCGIMATSSSRPPATRPSRRSSVPRPPRSAAQVARVGARDRHQAMREDHRPALGLA